VALRLDVGTVRGLLADPAVSEEEKRVAREVLDELGVLFEQNPLQRFHPHPKQREFLGLGRVPVKMFAGGNRAGKTTVGIVDDLIQCVDADCLPGWLRSFKVWEPPFACRVVAPSFRILETVVLEKLREWVPRGQLLGGSWEKAFDKQLVKVRFANGSWIDFLTYEQDVDKFSGAALDRVHFDEEPPGEKGRQIFNESRMRLIDRAGQALFTMTPVLGLTWTHDQIYEQRHEPNIGFVQADMEDNPHLDEVARHEVLAGLTDEERQARKEGRFVHFQGLVYSEFRDSGHVVGRPSPARVQGQSVLVGIDPGIRWTGVVWVAFDNDNSALAFHSEVYESLTVPQIAQAIKKVNRAWGLEKPRYTIDPSSRNRNAVNAENVEGAFMREGIFCTAAQNAVEAGVFEVKRRLQGGALVVSEDCSRLLWEIGRYRVAPSPPGGRPDQDRFEVVKQDDHCLDALRYALMERPWHVARTAVQERRRPGWIPNHAPAYRDPVSVSDAPMGSFS
jgi:phage terminase large subunit-like protein